MAFTIILFMTFSQKISKMSVVKGKDTAGIFLKFHIV